MTEHADTHANGAAGPPGNGRQAAHERLATGGARRAGRARCATHPWRVLFGWLGIVVVLIGLVATVGGGLRDEFEIPGSDTQKATDLIESRVRLRAGRRAQRRVRRAGGPAARYARAQGRDRRRRSPSFAPRRSSSRRLTGRPRRASGDPFSDATFSDSGRIAYAEAQFDRRDLRQGPRRGGRRRGRRARGASRQPASPSSTTARRSSRRSSRAPPSSSGCSPRSSCC